MIRSVTNQISEKEDEYQRAAYDACCMAAHALPSAVAADSAFKIETGIGVNYNLVSFSETLPKISFIPRLLKIARQMRCKLTVMFDHKDDWDELELTAVTDTLTVGDVHVDVSIKAEVASPDQHSVMTWLVVEDAAGDLTMQALLRFNAWPRGGGAHTNAAVEPDAEHFSGFMALLDRCVKEVDAALPGGQPVEVLLVDIGARCPVREGLGDTWGIGPRAATTIMVDMALRSARRGSQTIGEGGECEGAGEGEGKSDDEDKDMDGDIAVPIDVDSASEEGGSADGAEGGATVPITVPVTVPILTAYDPRPPIAAALLPPRPPLCSSPRRRVLDSTAEEFDRAVAPLPPVPLTVAEEAANELLQELTETAERARIERESHLAKGKQRSAALLQVRLAQKREASARARKLQERMRGRRQAREPEGVSEQEISDPTSATAVLETSSVVGGVSCASAQEALPPTLAALLLACPDISAALTPSFEQYCFAHRHLASPRYDC